ncbi:serine/threonine-protein kinase [Gordonia sp. FQ]|uniref:serine/threonine-protein kinase n=1 Tax=Gordonia sp. FQ TaxID=3446634 RepID=UPI003F87ABD1
MSTLEPGAEFAGYVIERRLGAGGMGEVYLAKHPRLPRHDALKVLAPQFTGDPAFRARFEREAELASGLRHPAIVTVYDRGEADGRLWISMAYVDGRDLADRLRESGPLAANQVGHVVSVIGDALDRANSRGLVHRDVKPANILLSDDGDVLLTDFGIARAEGRSTDLTATGATIGTLDYASPEQLQGFPVDGRSDQYSLACTAYALLTGHGPFADSNAALVIGKHLTQPLPSILGRRPDVTASVDAVLARATAKDPAQRYASSSEFAAALTAALAEVPGSAGTGSTSAGLNMNSASGPGTSASQPVPPPYPVAAQIPYARAMPPAAAPQAAPKKSRRLLWIIPVAVIAVLVLVATAIWYAIPDSWTAGEGDYLQKPTAAARDMELPLITPWLPSLETKPSGSSWEHRPPPGVEENDVRGVVGATENVVLVGRKGALDLVDPATAQIRRTIRVPGSYPPYACSVYLKETRALCQIGGKGDDFGVIDLVKGAVLTHLYSFGVGGVVVAGDSLVSINSISDNADITGYDANGKQTWTAHSATQFVHVIGPFVSLIRTSGTAPFQKTEAAVLRASDGSTLRTVPLTEDDVRHSMSKTAFTAYPGGFYFGGTFYDESGKKTADLADEKWEPVYITVSDGYNSYPDSGGFPALPIFYTSDAVGAVDPGTGKLLWSRKLDGAATAKARPAGRSVMLYNLYVDRDKYGAAWYDCATGEGGVTGTEDGGSFPLGSDGTRMAVSHQQDGSTVAGVSAFGPGATSPLWSLMSEDMSQSWIHAYAGHIYYKARRIV